MKNKKERIIIAITGASGAIYGLRLLEALQEERAANKLEIHLIISKAARITINLELDINIAQIEELADYTHNPQDIAACISSGSYITKGMIIVPCSMKSLAEIAHGLGSNLISRSADVVLKEKRKLVLMPRETPLSSIHLNNMKILSDMGAYICPPVTAFYNKPQTIDDIVSHTIGRVLDIFEIETNLARRWKEE